MINNSHLIGLFGTGVDTGSTFSGISTSTTLQKKQPTAPWAVGVKAPEPSAVLRSALAGRRLINEGAERVDLPGASADYRKLFALYKGLDALTALATRADQRGVGTSEAAVIRQRFTAGLAEVGGYLQTAGFDDIRLVHGTSSTTAKTTAAVPRDVTRIVTEPVHDGSLSESVGAFEGDVKFDITIGTLSGDKLVSIDLADLGAQTRTLDDVIAHINSKLTDVGVETRFGREKVNGEPRTIKAGTKTITLPDRADQWALVVQATSLETVRFEAADRSDAVYVVQGSGSSGANELLKFQSDGGASPDPVQVGEPTGWVAGRAGQTALPKGVETVRASAVAADGSLWLVADVESATGEQPIKGERDVALMKFDSSGRLMATRMLGASDQASGYAIAIAADGRVAVAGSVIGALEAGVKLADPGLADSFVTVFDDSGAELWTQRRGAKAADEATAVSFGDDGKVYVAGRSKSAMPGASALGGWDGYLQGFTVTQAHSLAPLIGVPVSISQFGTASDDSVKAMTIEGTSIYTAGVESGRVVVRQYSTAGGAPTLSATRDLGAANGDVTGIAVSGGRVVLTGTTRNAALDVATANTAHSGGVDAYIAVLEADLSVNAADRLTYVGGAGDDSVADTKVHNGKVWITGIADRAPGAKDEDPREGYLTRLDPLTGAVEWTRTWQGANLQASPLSLSVSTGGASVLDRLGLPRGTVSTGDSKILTDVTAVRPGDRFTVTPADGSRARTVILDAKDTLQTLAKKIEQASLGHLKVTVVNDSATGGVETDLLSGRLQRLSIVPRDGREGAYLSSGEPGRDALAALGLSPGIVAPKAVPGDVRTYALALPQSLSLAGPEKIKAAVKVLQDAMTTVRSAYRGLASGTIKPAVTGAAPAYLTAQIANYQAALARLGG